MTRTRNLNQQEVVHNFLNILPGYSCTGNVRHEGDGILWHYSTVETFRIRNNYVVSNLDCLVCRIRLLSRVKSDDSISLNALEKLADNVNPTRIGLLDPHLYENRYFLQESIHVSELKQPSRPTATK